MVAPRDRRTDVEDGSLLMMVVGMISLVVGR